jgi:hypothetical protein
VAVTTAQAGRSKYRPRAPSEGSSDRYASRAVQPRVRRTNRRHRTSPDTPRKTRVPHDLGANATGRESDPAPPRNPRRLPCPFRWRTTTG